MELLMVLIPSPCPPVVGIAWWISAISDSGGFGGSEQFQEL